MHSRLLTPDSTPRTYALIFDEGDEPMALLQSFASDHHCDAAHFTAIGAFADCTIMYFDWQKKDYKKIPVREQVEVVSMMGDIAEGPDGSPKIHAHIVLGRSDGTALAGHLDSGHVRPTLELILTETPAHLKRRHDDKTGLALIRLA